MRDSTILLPDTIAWLESCDIVQSAVLFGSAARDPIGATHLDTWSDLDVHVVATNPSALEDVDWTNAIPTQHFCLQVARQATGGVRKVTAIFEQGQLDLVVVPADALSSAAQKLKSGSHIQFPELCDALNEMATCLHTGYSFIKGEKTWGDFYAQVTRLPGVRLSDENLRTKAAGFLCDLLWVLQKIESGELIAAQHALHTKLVDVNLRLWREVRQRRGLSLPSFGLGRHLESLCAPSQLEVMSISAGLDRDELKQAAQLCFRALDASMKQLVPNWSVSLPMSNLLSCWLR